MTDKQKAKIEPKFCKCEHEINQAMISRILGSTAICRKCGKTIKPEHVEGKQ